MRQCCVNSWSSDQAVPSRQDCETITLPEAFYVCGHARPICLTLPADSVFKNALGNRTFKTHAASSVAPAAKPATRGSGRRAIQPPVALPEMAT